MQISEKVKLISEEHKYSSDHKLKRLGYGEWVEEPDEVCFEYKGYTCHVNRVYRQEPYNPEYWFGGHLCGYVEIPKDNKYYEKHYDDIDVDCHGGLTYSEMVDEKWKIGFDCAHSGDISPSIENFKKTNSEMKEFEKRFPVPKGFENFILFNPIYRNIEFCINECCNIVDQLI